MTIRRIGPVVPCLLLALGCGGSGGSSGSSGAGSSGTHMTWVDDGVPKHAGAVIAARSLSGNVDSLEVVGSSPDTGLSIFVTANAPLAPQTFVCNQTTGAQTVSISYTRVDSGLEFGTRTCTVSLTQVGGGGAAATGTFEMVFGLTDGGTKSITAGSFDVPVR